MTVAGLLVAPGASAGPDHRTLVALERGLEVPVSRVGITSRATARVLAGLRDEVRAFAGRLGAADADLALGGRSFGGRMCSMLVASGQPAAGLALLSYPLHPPGRPTQLRTDHFPDLHVPCLFVSGTKDPFATPAELEEHTARIPGPVEIVLLDGEAHSPRDDAAVVDAVRSWLSRL